LIARRGANEQTRLLYVAATRAKKTLYLSAAPKVKKDGTVFPRTGTLLASLWPALGSAFMAAGADAAAGKSRHAEAIQSTAAARAQLSEFSDNGAVGEGTYRNVRPGDAVANPSIAASEVPPAVVLRRLVPTWSPPDFSAPPTDPSRLPLGHQSLEPPQFTWVGETSRHIGTVVHAALEAFADADKLPTRPEVESDRDLYHHHLRRHGVPDRDLEQATAVVVEALTNTIGDERGRWILSREHREARSELTLTGIANGRLTDAVIDRSFVDRDGTRWVIDFKTSRHEGGGLEAFLKREMERYRPQLETYVALARGLGSNPVRAGLYFPLIGAFRELGP
jgi:ATP-dependent exoDNAse (exonuclease V) beta subunit